MQSYSAFFILCTKILISAEMTKGLYSFSTFWQQEGKFFLFHFRLLAFFIIFAGTWKL